MQVIVMEESFDFDMLIDDLTSITVGVMDRDQADVSVRTVSCEADANAEIMEEFGHAEYLQLVMINNDEKTKQFCPYFRVVMDSFRADEKANHHLQVFYQRVGMPSLSANCKKAMVLGMYDVTDINKIVSIPTSLLDSTMIPQDLGIGSQVDSDCLRPLKTALYGIEGVSIPYHIPLEAQWRILSFLRSPLAEMIEKKMSDICFAWDVFLHPMFQQREPRIPAHIASTYNLPTVLTTIYGATRSFLAPLASRNRPIVYRM
jgi:hypothetical protein